MNTTDAAEAPETVTELIADSTGVWKVTTMGTEHIFDLDAMTYTRYPSAASRGGAFPADCTPQELWRLFPIGSA